MGVYKIKDIAEEISIRVNDPKTSKLRKFVGLEHYVSGDVEITKYGNVEKLDSAMKEFRSGDILVARRNVYLKRASVVKFDGLTSGDSIVLRAISEDIAALMPFVLNTDIFWNYAQQHADGSMSKRLSPKLLMEYSFSMPDNAEERVKLACVLWAIERNKDANNELLRLTDDLVKSQFIEMFGDPTENPYGLPYITLQSLIDKGWITYHLDGNHGGDYPRSHEFVAEGVPYISANCIADGNISFDNAKYVTVERAKKFKKGIAQDKDVLFAHNATVGPVAILHTTEQTIILGTSLTAYRCNPKHIIPEYLAAYMLCPAFKEQYEREMQQSTRKQVPITTQRKYLFLIPQLDEQKRFAQFIQQTDKSKFEIKQAIESLKKMEKKLINEALS